MLDITQTEVDRTLTVRYTGELDQHTARQTIERSEDLLVLYPCDSLVLDLSGLTFMDSSGLAVVLHLHRTCALRLRFSRARYAAAAAARL